MKRLASLFRALAEDTRLKILWLLCLSDELCVCDVTHLLGITQSKASRHLRYLLNQGLVSDRRDGAWMYYHLAVPPGSDIAAKKANYLKKSSGRKRGVFRELL